MRLSLILIGTALACGTVLAQAPQGTLARPAAEANPNASGGIAQARGELNKDVRTGTLGAASMDLNGDGMISKKEWDTYHARMWRSMKADKRGLVPWADVQSGMAAGQGGTPK